MERFLITFSFASSSSSSSKTVSLKNCEEISYDKLEQSIYDWTIPEVKTREVYKIGSFKLQTDYLVKKIERTESIMRNIESLTYFS